MFYLRALEYTVIFLCMCCYSPQMLRISPFNLINIRLNPQITLQLITEAYPIPSLHNLPIQ
jgi:hypothetical protein